MDARVVLLYLGTWSLVALTPGPAVMCAMSQATRHGFRSALAGIAGIQLGHFVFFGCVASGLATLLATASTAFAIVRVAGALYLMYVGIRIIAGTFSRRAQTVEAAAPPARRSLLLQGFVIQVSNPKALIFMSALLPQFIRPDHRVAPQLLTLLAVTITVDVLVLGGYAWLAVRGARSLRGSGVMAWLERTLGAALVVFGVKLFADTRR